MAFAQDKAHEAKFQWVTGEPVKYKNWSYGEPNNYGNTKEFYAVIKSDGSWNDFCDDENDKQPGVYERKTAPPKDSTIEWLRWEKNLGGTDNWYGVNNDKMFWKEHKEAAEKLGAHLATISSVEENSFVFSITSKKWAVWIGLAHPTGPPTGPPTGRPHIELPPPGGYWKTNLIGRGPGFEQIPATSPTNSAPQQNNGTYNRISLRMRQR